MRLAVMAIVAVGLVGSSARAEPSGVAVLDIQATGVDPDLLPILNEVLATELARQSDFRVISGADVTAMLGHEAQKQLGDCSSDDCLVAIGGALGVDRVVVATLAALGDRFVLNVKLIHSRQAQTEGRAYEEVDNDTSALTTAIRRSVAQLLGKQAPVPALAAEADPGLPWLPIGLWAAGAVGVGIGVGFMVDAAAHYDKATDPTFVGGQKHVASAQSSEVAGWIALGVGVASAATGLVVWLLAGGEHPPVAVAPMVGHRAAAVNLVWQL